jgi:hypothetical protein
MPNPKRVHGPAQVSNAAATKYTVPTNIKAVMRYVHLYNPSGSSVNFTLTIGADAAAVRLFDAFPVPAAGPYPVWLYEPLVAGEILQAFAGTNNILVLTISVDEDAA